MFCVLTHTWVSIPTLPCTLCPNFTPCPPPSPHLTPPSDLSLPLHIRPTHPLPCLFSSNHPPAPLLPRTTLSTASAPSTRHRPPLPPPTFPPVWDWFCGVKGCVLIASWGVPGRSYPDNGNRCLAAAVEMRASLQVMDMKTSIGITTGHVRSLIWLL